MSTRRKHSDLFHITIGAAPSGDLSLGNDTRLVKAALLYADHATLCSPKGMMIFASCAIGELKGDHQIEFLAQIAPSLVGDPDELFQLQEHLQTIRRLARKRSKNKQEILVLLATRQIIARQWQEVKKAVEQLATDAGAQGLATALSSGLLDVHPIGVGEDIDSVVSDFVNYIARMVSAGGTYPLFDDATGGLVDAMAREGQLILSDSAMARARHPQLASHLFQRLPVFNAATVEEVLDIRRELGVPLIRFRAAVMKFSDSIRSAVWDKDFVHDAEEVVQKEVAPAVLDIEEEVRSNRYLTALAYKIAEKPLSVPAGSILGFGVSKLSEVPELSGYALGAGAGAVVASTAADAYREWEQRRQATERNQLYFYYKAGRMMS